MKLVAIWTSESGGDVVLKNSGALPFLLCYGVEPFMQF